MLAYLLAFSIDWTALLTQDNLIPFIFGLLIVVLPQYKEQLEKLKALFGKGESPAAKLARVQAVNDALHRQIGEMHESNEVAMVASLPDPRADANVALQALTDHFIENSNAAGVELLKPLWAEINKVAKLEVPPAK